MSREEKTLYFKEKEFIRVQKPSKSLTFLYETAAGRFLLKGLTHPALSRMAGRFLDSSCSAWLNGFFLRVNRIPTEDYLEKRWPTFNACFTRQIRPELRPYDLDPEHFVSPCDGLLSVYPIEEGLVLPVKMSSYSIERLLRDQKLAAEFAGGTCLVFRLCVNHYHRYTYVESGRKCRDRFIPGILHTVQPIALMNRPVFTENSRAYTVIRTDSGASIVQMEVGAMLVGKIHNNRQQACFVERGREKGCFLYGGSTIIVLVQKDQVQFPDWFFESADPNLEIPVKMGEALGSWTRKANSEEHKEDE